MDLPAGQLVIKARLGEDIRKVAISNLEISKDELLLMMQRIFKGFVTPQDKVVLKYADEDGDLVTISDDSDLNFAIQCFKVLKLTLLVNDEPRPLQHDQIKDVKDELREIRDKANGLLDKLDVVELKDNVQNEIVREPSPVVNRLPNNVMNHEFDPLTNKSPPKPAPPVEEVRPPVPIQSPEKPPSVYGMGFQEPNLSRPDTPNSHSSRRAGSEQSDHVATIQPSMHQQINAGHAPNVLNGPPTSMFQPQPPQPPIQQNGRPQPTQVPQGPPQLPVFQGAPQPPVQQGAPPPQPPMQQGAPPQAPIQQGFPPQPPMAHAPPVSQGLPQVPMQQQQQQPQQQHQQHPPQPAPPNAPYYTNSGYAPQTVQSTPPPTPMPAVSQYNSGQPPQYSQQQAYGHPAPPMGAAAPPMGPPMGGAPGGANPFTRGGMPPTSAAYRPAYPNPSYQM